MPQFTKHAPGTFSWPELSTTDQQGDLLPIAKVYALAVLLMLAFGTRPRGSLAWKGQGRI